MDIHTASNVVAFPASRWHAAPVAEPEPVIEQTVRAGDALAYEIIDSAVKDGRDAVIAGIKAALKRRTGRPWSVTGGKGTAWGWIRIDVLPRDARKGAAFVAAKREELGITLGEMPVYSGGVSVAASSAHYREYLERANGLPVRKVAQAYWD